jgi:hypothetical protein
MITFEKGLKTRSHFVALALYGLIWQSENCPLR